MPYFTFAPPSLVVSHDWRKRFTRVEANGSTAGLLVAAAVVGAVYLAAKNWHYLPAPKAILNRAPRLADVDGATPSKQLKSPRTPKART